MKLMLSFLSIVLTDGAKTIVGNTTGTLAKAKVVISSYKVVNVIFFAILPMV